MGNLLKLGGGFLAIVFLILTVIVTKDIMKGQSASSERKATITTAVEKTLYKTRTGNKNADITNNIILDGKAFKLVKSNVKDGMSVDGNVSESNKTNETVLVQGPDGKLYNINIENTIIQNDSVSNNKPKSKSVTVNQYEDVKGKLAARRAKAREDRENRVRFRTQDPAGLR